MPNDGSPDGHAQGSPVTVYFPADALRVLPPTSADAAPSGDTPGE
jgi:hypothetical protein